MISYKTGVKAFGEGTARLQGNSARQTRSLSAKEQQSRMGDTPIGDYLNQVSDPNWVDPAKKMRQVGNDQLDRDAFFKLMLEQMKRQDPTNPMKSHEMAAQLAQFSSIEQLNNINSSLQELKQQQSPVAQFQALQFIGKSVSGDAANVSRFEGDTFHDFQFELPAVAAEAKVSVRDAKGQEVRAFTLRNLKQGKNQISWNGMLENGSPARPGEYRFSIEAKDNQGKRLNIKTDFSGQITGVNFTKEGAVLMVGNKTVKLADVKSIVDPQVLAAKNGQNVRQIGGLDLKAQAGSKNTEEVKKAPAPKPAGNLQDIAMSGEMLNRLDKETSGVDQ